MFNRMTAGLAVLWLCAGAVAGARAEGYTWSGAYGNGYWQTAAGHTTAPELPSGIYGNGWGRTWEWNDADWSQYYPKPDDDVTIPDGLGVHPNGAESGQGSASTCATLTIGVGASITESATHGLVDVHGVSFVNNGLFSTGLRTHGTALTLSGAGEIFLNAHDISVHAEHCALSFGSGQNVHGVGNIGAANPVVNNQNPDITNVGTIRADGHDWRHLGVFGWTNNTNSGLIVASAGATLDLGGQWQNHNVIRAEDGGVVNFSAFDYSGGGITGGRLESIGTGVFNSYSGYGFVLRDLTVSGRVHVTGGNEHLGLAGSINCDGGAELMFGRMSASGFTYGTMQLHGDTMLDGAGQTILGYSGRVDVPTEAPGPRTLTVGAAHTLAMLPESGIDTYGIRQIALVNRGTVHHQPLAGAEGHHTTVHLLGGTTNEGCMTFDKLDGPGRVYWIGDIIQNAGELIVNGYVQLNPFGTSYACRVLGGTLGGSGTLRNDTTGIHVGPDAVLSPGNSAGTLTVVGPMNVADGASFLCEVGPTDADTVIVTGALTFEGALHVTLGGDGLTAERMADVTLFEFGSMPAAPAIQITGPAGWSWGEVSQVGNTLVLRDVVALPEPTTVLLALVAFALPLARRR